MYQQWVLDVEMGSFTPLVFRTNGGMGNEYQRFLKHLADHIAQKDTKPYKHHYCVAQNSNLFRTRRSVDARVSCSRTPVHSKIEHSLDCEINLAANFQLLLYYI